MASIKYIRVFFVALLLTALADLAESQTLSVHGAYAWVSPGGKSAAAYFRLENRGHARQVTEAHSGIAARTVLHGHAIDETGTARMLAIHDGIKIPAGTSVSFEPGGPHVMFMGLTERPQVGDSIAFRLTLANGMTLDVLANVQTRGEWPRED